MSNTRFFSVAVFCFISLFLCLSFSAGQGVPAAETPTEGNASDMESAEPLVIRLSVNEVRLDVVVLDNKRNPVTDLTADDFEVSQNGARQKVLSSVYIDSQSDAAAKPSVSRKNVRNQNIRNLPAIPAADLKMEDTRRTIIFVVDDLSMSFQDVHFARMALRNFVEKQMQTGDMVAILRTGHGNSALQMFLSDKQQLSARINSMRMERAISPNIDGSHLYRVYDNQLSTMSYSLRALEDMPGRKILIMMTSTTWLRKSAVPAIPVLGIELIDFDALYKDRFSRLADDALRAGVVINSLNIRGLHFAPDLTIGEQWNIDRLRDAAKIGTESEQIVIGMLIEDIQRESMGYSPISALNPLPVKTGGVIIENSNFFLDGVGKETESLMRGYYLISYTPPPDTFAPGDKEIFNQIKVNVKRKNVQVYSRDGFYNRPGPRTDATSSNPLQDAIFSPFIHTDINVNMSAGYVRDDKAGYLIRSWIHLEPKDIIITETEDGGAKIDLEMLCLTSDIDGFVQDSRRGHLTISNVNSPENIALLRRRGIRFTMLLPVKKPGSYYVRTAVEDAGTGRIGSAYQFVEIPDLEKKELALSNIFMAAGDEGFNWMVSDLTDEIAEVVSFSGFSGAETRSPAQRTYAPGDSLVTRTMLYNAGVKADSEIETQSILYKDGEEFMRGAPVTIGPDAARNLSAVPISQNWTAGADLPPGDYDLQLAATDRNNAKKNKGFAVQSRSFTIAVDAPDEYNVVPASENEAVRPPAHPLEDAVFSPSPRTDIGVNIAAGYVKNADAGYLVRSWIHVDPDDVIVETKDGGARIELEALCVTTDINGKVADSRSVNLTISDIIDEELAWIRKHGIRFVLLLPVKKPGSYQVRIAVRDNESGRTGSALRSVEIPDLEKGAPALSSIFVITGEEDGDLLNPEAAKGIDEGTFFTEFQSEETASPALGIYAAGDSMQTLAILYNAGANADSEIEIQPVFYKDGKEYKRGEAVPIRSDAAQRLNGIPVLQNWTLDADMPPGDYVLQLYVIDKNGVGGNEAAAAQTMNFRIVK